MFHIGDTVRLQGSEDTYEVKAVDENFEGEGEAVAIFLPETQAIEFFSATLVELVTASKVKE